MPRRYSRFEPSLTYWYGVGCGMRVSNGKDPVEMKSPLYLAGEVDSSH
jgi:hypothetical protein